jgi:hypothetical protein
MTSFPGQVLRSKGRIVQAALYPLKVSYLIISQMAPDPGNTLWLESVSHLSK